MIRSSRTQVSWADLPKELLEKISKCIDTEIDALRFGAVCKSWRTSAAPFKKFPRKPLKLPFPFVSGEASHPRHHGAYFTLAERTVYRVQSPEFKEPPNFWLVKVERSDNGRFHILNPVSDRRVKILPENPMPRVLNTLDFRVSEVCKAYTLLYVNPSRPKQNNEYKYAKKVVLSANVENEEYVVMVIDDTNWLWCIRSGDENWQKVSDHLGGTKFVDIVNYNGSFFGVDLHGGAWKFKSSFVAEQIVGYRFQPPASKRYLVDLHKGELFMVEVMTDKDKRPCTCYNPPEDGCSCGFRNILFKNTAVEIGICRIDQGKEEWLETKMVNDRIIFVGDDCSFSVSDDGCGGTLVFYTDPYIFFKTEEPKQHYHSDHGLDYDYCYDYDDDDDVDYGYDCFDYNYFECGCDCGYSFNESARRTDSYVPSDDVKLEFRGLHGHNTGVCSFETGKIGSLLMFPEYGNIFWPPPSWLSRRN